MANHHAPAALLSHLTPARRTRRSKILLRGHCMVNSLIFIYWSMYTPQTYFKFKVLTYARIDSVTEPIWLTLSSRQLQAFSSTALLMRLGLVTVRSSPTIWMSVLPVKLVQAAQSSWSKGSSMETTASGNMQTLLIGWWNRWSVWLKLKYPSSCSTVFPSKDQAAPKWTNHSF